MSQPRFEGQQADVLSSAREEPGSVDHHGARAGRDGDRPTSEEGEPSQNWELAISFSWILQVKKRVVMVMARQHPGESPASYVVQVFECLLRVKI